MRAPPEPGIRRPRAELWQGIPSWELSASGVHARFLGRGAPPRDAALAERLAPTPAELSWVKQVHSDRVLEAEPGLAGEGDALIVRRAGLGAAIATADCVPIVLVGERSAAAVHAGWRGIAAGVVARALAAMGEPVAAAWIGPSIGPCCYEVGDEVARAVASASDERAVTPGRGERPHLDLRAAVAAQLVAGGVGAIEIFDLCTRCRPELLASYRRDGERAGRNLTIVWRDR